SALGGNVDTERIIDPQRFACDILVAEFYETSMQIDAYPLIFNAIGDAERCGEALARARGFVEARKERTINAPAAVLESTRARNAERFATIPGLRVPRTMEMTRAEIAAAPFAFPILLRSPGYHTGEHFELIENAEALPNALATLPGERLLAIEYIDTRRADGSFEKYRVLIVGERLYPIHLARSQQWKVHYFSSHHSDEGAERAFLAEMSATIGARACATLDRVRVALGLDYGGIDFALDARGNVVLFEANATMNLFDPGPDAAAERRTAFDAVRTAVSALLDSRGSDRS
ncbi:MAG: ATP-grasp domain-containing protein, partial [Candidatus Baltobacteraceae bacterium]